MSDALARALATGPAALTALGRGPVVLLALLVVLVPGLLFIGSQWVGDGQYVPLFAGLTPEDGGAIVTQLRTSKTPYRVGGAGEILVPADRAAELRLRMAVQGLPLGGGVGFEVFDRPSLGVSDFAQRLNYQRALQGELSRTIGQLREVQRARVHLALPQPSLFADRERPASASVVLKIAPGARLGREEVRGVVHLVASSVEGLAPERVTVIDTAGRVLSMGGDPGGATAMSPRRLELKTAVEETLERRVQSLLDATLGSGHAIARVSAQVNFDQVERTEEKYDPNAVARQRTKSTESTSGNATTPTAGAGAPDPASVAAAPSPASTSKNQSSRESETVNYEVSRVVARTLTAPGEIRRLSVAVILSTPGSDRAAERPADGSAAGGAGRKEPAAAPPRAPEEIEKIKKVVMGAVGFSQERGDEVTVVEMPFDTTALERERLQLDKEPAPAGHAGPAGPVGVGLVVTTPVIAGVVASLVIALAVAAWLVLRQSSRRRALTELQLSLERSDAAGLATTSGAASPAVPRAPRRPAAPLVPEELLELSRERDDIRQKALTMASTEPDATAQLLRAWLVKKKPQAVGRAGA